MLLQDVLKKPEYFGKFGKIHKVVINQNTAYAGSQTQVGCRKLRKDNVDCKLKQLLSNNSCVACQSKISSY